MSSFDFCMCNPPFFADLEETGLNEKVICTGTSNELVTEGGEQSFVSKMITESVILKHKIRYERNSLENRIQFL